MHGVPDKDNFWADSHRTTVGGVRDSSGDTAGTPRSTDMETAEGHTGFMRQAMEHAEDIMSHTRASGAVSMSADIQGVGNQRRTTSFRLDLAVQHTKA